MASEEQSEKDKEKAYKEACLAVRTGMSACENGNYKVAEPLFLRALDDFELCGVATSKEYFQCLLYLADAYFHMDRFFEAKGYYEQLSVARLKNPESTDAQVVVALIKLATTLEKLGQIDDAVNTYDLILELAETTIPKGHALYGVIFDSFEILVERYVDDPEIRATRLARLKEQRQQYGFTETLSGHYSALPADATKVQEAASEAASEVSGEVLTQSPDQLRTTLSPWTHPELKQYAAELRARRDSLEFSPGLHDGNESASSVGSSARMTEGSDEVKLHGHLDPEMFKPKRAVAADAPVEAVEHSPGDISHLDGDARRHLKKVNTEKRFNPLPVITVTAAVSIVLGAIYFAHEYAQNMVAVTAPVTVDNGLDLAGQAFATADGKKTIRFTTAAACEFTSGGVTASGTYHRKGAETSAISGILNGNAAKMSLKETEAGYEAPDGTVYYADTSKERQILTKVQAVANFANYFYASHSHVYPASTSDNQFSGTTFNWENPLTGSTNPPLVDSAKTSSNSFEESFTQAVRDFRNLKPHFAVDDAEHPPAGLIECFALVPANPGEADTSGLIIRAYDSHGKLIRGADPSKAFVVALKNGVSVDPMKASRETVQGDTAAEAMSFEIEPLPAKADKDKAKESN